MAAAPLALIGLIPAPRPAPGWGGDVATFQGHRTMTGLETPGLDCETGPFKVWSPWHSGYKKLGWGS